MKLYVLLCFPPCPCVYVMQPLYFDFLVLIVFPVDAHCCLLFCCHFALAAAMKLDSSRACHTTAFITHAICPLFVRAASVPLQFART